MGTPEELAAAEAEVNAAAEAVRQADVAYQAAIGKLAALQVPAEPVAETTTTEEP